MGRWEVGHGRVSRGVLQTEHGLQKREKVALEPGSRDCKAGYETSNCGELRVRWRELCALGEGGQKMSVPRWVLQSGLGRFQDSRHREG